MSLVTRRRSTPRATRAAVGPARRPVPARRPAIRGEARRPWVSRACDIAGSYRSIATRSRATRSNVPLWISKCHGHIGATLFALGRYRDARPELETALTTMTKLRGETSPEAAIWRGDLGRVWLGLRDPPRAIAELERALAVLDQGGRDHVDRGLYRTYLAMARWRSGDHPRALEQARQAHALLDTAGPDGKDALDELTTWERTRR